jgi:hypothetical protein
MRRPVEELLQFDTCTADPQIAGDLTLPRHILSFDVSCPEQGDQHILFVWR